MLKMVVSPQIYLALCPNAAPVGTNQQRILVRDDAPVMVGGFVALRSGAPKNHIVRDELKAIL